MPLALPKQQNEPKLLQVQLTVNDTCPVEATLRAKASASATERQCHQTIIVDGYRREHSSIYIGGWGGESAAAPTGKSFRFVRACERAGARAARDQLMVT